MAEEVPKPESPDEQRMVDLAEAAAAFEPVAQAIFSQHKTQAIPILLMLSANTLHCVQHGNGKPLADSSTVSDEDVVMAFQEARAIVVRGPAYLLAFIYALGAAVSKQIIQDNLMLEVSAMADEVDS